MKKFLLLIALALGLACPAANAATTTFVFDSKEAMAQCVTVSSTKYDGWRFYSYPLMNSIKAIEWYCTANGGNYDAWLILPGFEAKKGQSYDVEFTVADDNLVTLMGYEICVGREQTTEAQTQVLKSVTGTPQYSHYHTYSAGFTASENGTYYFSFHIMQTDHNGSLLFEEAKISTAKAKPQKVTDVTATRDPKGAMKVDLEWTWPTRSDHNSDLTSLTKANIYRHTKDYWFEAERIATAEGGAPGTKGTFTDTFENGEKAAHYYYYVVPCDANGESDEYPTTVDALWVGHDTSLKAPENLEVTLHIGSMLDLSFSAPAGAHGGYVDPDDVQYSIYRYTGEFSSSLKPIKQDISLGAEPVFSELKSNMEVFGWYKYRVYCKLKSASSYTKYADSPEFVGGSYAEVPFTDDFSNPDYFNTFYTTKGNDWSLYGKALHATGTTTGSDYFLTPPLFMYGKYKYNLTCTASTFTSTSSKGNGDAEHDFKTLNIYFAEKNKAMYEFEKCEPIYTYEFHKGEEWEIALDLETGLYSSHHDSFCLIFQVVSEEGASNLGITIDDLHVTRQVKSSYVWPVENAAVTLSADQTTATITFEESPENDEDCTYLVVRMPDQEIIALNETETTYEDEGVDQLPEGTYYYAIFTICDGNVSRAAMTNEVSLGTATGVKGISAAATGLSYDARQQAVTAPAGETVAIYSLDGRMVESVVSGGMVEVRHLHKGIYIVRCGDKSIKLVVK